MKHPTNARQKGLRRKRIRHRAERREATTPIRLVVNEMRLKQGHPGWQRPLSIKPHLELLWDD